MIRIAGRIIRIPHRAARLELAKIHHLGDGINLLKELDAETLSNMPRRMAVEQPCSRIVGYKGNEEPAPL